MSEQINVKGIDQAELLVALYQNTRALGMGAIHDAPDFSIEEARAVLDKRGKFDFDYVLGRPIKSSIDADGNLDPRLYDRDAGAGTCRWVVDKLKSLASDD